jgi:hypothetical protein
VTFPFVRTPLFEVPVTVVPVRVRAFPAGFPEFTVMFNVPVTLLAASVVSVAFPVALTPDTKQALVVRNVKALKLRAPPPAPTENVVTKSSAPLWPLPPTRDACQLPLADVVTVVVVLFVLVPQEQTRISNATSARIANFFIRRP